ncbi:MAG: hypothetical protein ACOC0Q_08100, partial [Wenzhouxiangella sp.]
VGMMAPAPNAQDERRLAAQLAATILGDSTGSRLFYALVDPAIADDASLAYEALALGRGNLDRLLAVRGPSSLARAVGEISSANLRFAGQCLTRPPRWAVNSTAALFVASLKPWLRRENP